MSLKIKPYNPMHGQQRAKRRRQKQSAERLTLVPSSVTCIDTPLSQTSVAGHKCFLVEEKFIPSVNMDGTEDPYSGFPSIEECLEFCSPQDKNIPSANTPTSTNLLSCPDSIIDFQDVSSKFSHQEAYKDDQLKRKALASELNIGREFHNSNNSNTPASTTVSAWESDISISPAESVWSSDAKILSLIASNISTPASATSPTDQQQISTSRKKDSSANSEGSAQDCRARMADLDVPNTISKDVLSGVDRPVLEFQENIASEPLSSDSSNRLVNQDIQAVHILASSASIMEEESVAEHSDTKLSVTEPSSAVKSLTQVASSSTKRSFSESATTSDSQPFISDYCQTSKRLRLTSPLLEEAVSTLLCVQEMISNVLAKLDQGQPHSLIPDVSVQSISDSINVAMDGVGDDSSDNSSSIGSSFDDSDSETELTASKSRCSQQKSTQRCRWTKKDEKLLRTLKGNQKRNGGKPSDYQIANKLDRTESGVKQHWDIMMRREQKSSSKH